MTYTVIVRPLAEQDLQQAQVWYDKQRSGLGAEFRTTVDALLSRLAQTPLLYPVVYREVRRAVLRRFPYSVYFAVSGNSVTLLACLHSSRDPRLVRSRTR